jgi:hypothetical protein
MKRLPDRFIPLLCAVSAAALSDANPWITFLAAVAGLSWVAWRRLPRPFDDVDPGRETPGDIDADS